MSYQQFEIWHQTNGYYIAVFVIELNPAEIIARKVLPQDCRFEWERHLDHDRPWPYKREGRLILRRWNIGTAGLKRAWLKGGAWEVSGLFRDAERLRGILDSQVANGEPFNPQPDYERRFKDGKSNRPKKKGPGRAQRAADEPRVLGAAGDAPGDR